MIKKEEDCKGEKWNADCHSNPDNCSRSHLHLKNASKAAAGETVFNGYVVPANYSVGACGEHLYPSSGSASDHASKTGACGHKYYACTPGDHDQLQASCSTDAKCRATNFYLCQHQTHDYTKTLLACGHAEGSEGYHTEIPMECGEKFWYCHGDIDNVLDSHQRIACPLNASGEKCNVLGGHFYACAPHTHKYPDGTLISSPGSKFTRECGEHQVTASEASSHEAVKHSCGRHSYYALPPTFTSKKESKDVT